MATKATETTATERALATFGNPFGVALYAKDLSPVAKPAQHPRNGDDCDRFPHLKGAIRMPPGFGRIRNVARSSACRASGPVRAELKAKRPCECQIMGMDWPQDISRLGSAK
jgi:hypothetical protein